MKRRSYGRDTGLTLRMLATGGLLGLLYVFFAVVTRALGADAARRALTAFAGADNLNGSMHVPPSTP